MDEIEAMIDEVLRPILGPGAPVHTGVCRAVKYVLPDCRNRWPSSVTVEIGTGCLPKRPTSGPVSTNGLLWDIMLKRLGGPEAGMHNVLVCCWDETKTSAQRTKRIMLKDTADPAYVSDLVAKVNEIIS